MIKRTLFNEDHEAFRDTVRKFIAKEIAPYHAQWEEDGIVPTQLWLKAGAAGMLCCTIPEEYGGLGLDYLFDVVVFEEMARSGFTGPGFLIHCDLVATYVKSFGTDCVRSVFSAPSRPWISGFGAGRPVSPLGRTRPWSSTRTNPGFLQSIKRMPMCSSRTRGSRSSTRDSKSTSAPVRNDQSK